MKKTIERSAAQFFGILLPVLLWFKVFQPTEYDIYIERVLLVYETFYWVMLPIMAILWICISYLVKDSKWKLDDPIKNLLLSAGEHITIGDKRIINYILSLLTPFEFAAIAIGIGDVSFAIAFGATHIFTYAFKSSVKAGYRDIMLEV